MYLIEKNSFKLLKTNDLFRKLIELTSMQGLLLEYEVCRKGTLEEKNYYSQICIDIYDRQHNDLFLKEEENVSLELFADIIFQNNKKIHFYDLKDDNDFWNDLQFLIDIIEKKQYLIKN